MAPAPDDAAMEATRLLTAITAAYGAGRRYRAIADYCEDAYFARTLDLRMALHRAERQGGIPPALLVELDGILTGLRAAVTRVQAGTPYRDAHRAWEVGDDHALGHRIPDVFARVEPYVACAPLVLPVPLVAMPRSAEHFLTPMECAHRIASLARDGLAPASEPPDLGADAHIRAIVLDDPDDPPETPVALLVETRTTSVGPLFRVAPGGSVLCYRPHLTTRITVRAQCQADDEWWSAGGRTYGDYVDQLAAALGSFDIPLVRA